MTGNLEQTGPFESVWDEVRDAIEQRQDFVLEQLDQLANQVEQLVELCIQVRDNGSLDNLLEQDSENVSKAA